MFDRARNRPSASTCSFCKYQTSVLQKLFINVPHQLDLFNVCSRGFKRKYVCEGILADGCSKKLFFPSIFSGPVTAKIVSNFKFWFSVHTGHVSYFSSHQMGRIQYEYNHEDYVNGFGEANFDTPSWFGLKKMKRITDEGRNELVVFYEDNFDVFFDFKLLNQGLQMTYSHFEGAAGGIAMIVVMLFLSVRFSCHVEVFQNCKPVKKSQNLT